VEKQYKLALEQMQQEQTSKTTEVSEFQSIGDDTTLAAAKTKAKAACLSHICQSIHGTSRCYQASVTFG